MKHNSGCVRNGTAALVLALASLVFLTGASIWEGAAAIAPGGDLPDSGLFIATNSFPRNTVVDVTNLETGKTVRAIVASGLDSPGLLALVSREAADSIGLPVRSIGRVRMSMPSDPIAFSRYAEDNVRSGDPDYDPMAALNGAYGTAVPGPSRVTEAPKVEEAPVVEPGPSSGVIIAETTGPAESAEPEAVITEAPAETKVPEIAEIPPAVTAPEPPAEFPEDTAWIVAEPVPVEEPPSIAKAPPELPPAPVTEEPETVPSYTLVPAAEQPPEIDNSWFIDTLPIEPSVPTVTELPPAVVTPPAAAARPPASGTFMVPPGTFSVPAIGELQKGLFYLQLGAYSKVDTVEKEISKIEKSYPLAVQCAGSMDRPVYRILVGPVNHGESGALLQRFKTSGYKDAFIRSGN